MKGKKNVVHVNLVITTVNETVLITETYRINRDHFRYLCDEAQKLTAVFLHFSRDIVISFGKITI